MQSKLTLDEAYRPKPTHLKILLKTGGIESKIPNHLNFPIRSTSNFIKLEVDGNISQECLKYVHFNRKIIQIALTNDKNLQFENLHSPTTCFTI